MTIYDEDQPGHVSWRRDYTYDEQGRLLRSEEGNGTISTTFNYNHSGLWATVVKVDPLTVIVTRYSYSFAGHGL